MKAKKPKPSRTFKRRIIRAHLSAAVKSCMMARDIDEDIMHREVRRIALMDPRVLRMRIKTGKL